MSLFKTFFHTSKSAHPHTILSPKTYEKPKNKPIANRTWRERETSEREGESLAVDPPPPNHQGNQGWF